MRVKQVALSHGLQAVARELGISDLALKRFSWEVEVPRIVGHIVVGTTVIGRWRIQMALMHTDGRTLAVPARQNPRIERVRPVYHLSGRQVKQLHSRSSELRIAIPRPADSADADDPLAFARAVLPAIEPERLVAAEWSQVSVGPPSGDGLAGVIGVILDEDATASEWHWTVDVAVVTLRPRLARRQSPRLQWPGKCECGGGAWPKAKGDDGASGAAD